MPVESDARTLPLVARRLYGCVNCEWKQFNLCPWKLNSKQSVRKGICEDRTNWLLSFSRSYKEKPSYYQWQRDFNRAMVQVRWHKDYTQLIAIELKLEKLKLDKDSDVKEIASITSEHAKLRKQWIELWRELSKSDEKQLDREKPLKVEHSFSGKIPLSEIHRIMREHSGEDIVDAEFTEDEETKTEEKTDGEK